MHITDVYVVLDAALSPGQPVHFAMVPSISLAYKCAIQVHCPKVPPGEWNILKSILICYIIRFVLQELKI